MDPAKQAKVMREFQKQSAQMDMTVRSIKIHLSFISMNTQIVILTNAYWYSDWDDVRCHRWCFRQWRSWRRNRGFDKPGTFVASYPLDSISKNRDCFKGLTKLFLWLFRFLMKSALISPHRFVFNHRFWSLFCIFMTSLWLNSLFLFWSICSYHPLQKVKLAGRIQRMLAGMVSIKPTRTYL